MVTKFSKMLKEKLGIRSPSLIFARDCRACKHHHTSKCPNSHLCYSTVDKPYFEAK